MDWLALQATYPRDSRMPERYAILTALTAVLNGKQYDSLHHPFSKEQTDGGEYIPLSQRRPSVRSNLCRVVVEDSASMLFSEGHWPAIKAAMPNTTEALAALVKEVRLNDIMLRAATLGSVGSIAIHMRCLEGRVFFSVLQTASLSPTWLPTAPDTLASVTERRVVTGADLIAQGYNISADDAAKSFWFQRIWDDQKEAWFNPVPVLAQGRDVEFVEDASRTVVHGLGFVPIEWVRNLPRDDGPDGQCTFEGAIDTVIEIDYLLSQGGRGLKYASDPTLAIMAGDGSDQPVGRVGGAANALLLPPKADAKLLEINGNAALAVLQQVQELRALALEIMHGNRAHADKLSAATSGRSIEMMMSGLIWLADRLRISYGEGALLGLLRMVCAASAVIETGLTIGGVNYQSLDPAGLELAWASWLPPMPRDVLETAQALVTAVKGGVLSAETGAARFGALVDVDDAKAEWARIVAETPAPDDAAANVRKAASEGVNDTRHETA